MLPIRFILMYLISFDRRAYQMRIHRCSYNIHDLTNSSNNFNLHTNKLVTLTYTILTYALYLRKRLSYLDTFLPQWREKRERCHLNKYL